MRGIVLDTVNPNGEANGSLDSDQFAWLENELQTHSRAWIDTDGTITARARPTA